MSDPQDISESLSPNDKTSSALQTCHTLLGHLDRPLVGAQVKHSLPSQEELGESHTLEASRAETVGAAVSAVREAVKALSWALAAAMRPSMSMLALGVRTRGLAVLGLLATTGVLALDSSSAHTINTSFETIPPTFLHQRTTSVQYWSMSPKDPAVSCSHRQIL